MNNIKRYLSTIVRLPNNTIVNNKNTYYMKRESPFSIRIYKDIPGENMKLPNQYYVISHWNKESSDEYFNDLKIYGVSYNPLISKSF